MLGVIFGANGQDGFYLDQHLKALGFQSIGISRSGPWLPGDVADFRRVMEIVESYRPDFIFHLAARSTTRHDALFDNYRSIGGGTLNILEAVYRHSRHTKVFIAGSGVQFQNCGLPISEKEPFNPGSPYAAARIYAVNLARYFRTLGVKTYIGYLFHHESPLRQSDHVSQKIIQAVRTIDSGKNGIINLGDVTVEKEWTFAGDIVDGIMALVSQDNVFEAAIGSGCAHSIQNWLEICFDLIGKKWPDYVRIDNDIPTEYRRLVSNPSTIFSLGWKPRIGIAELARMMFEAEY